MASCGQDGNLIVWKEVKANEWERVKEFINHKGTLILTIAITCSWTPHECGLILAVGTSDGNITIITGNEFTAISKSGHTGGVTAVSWCSSSCPDLLDNPSKEISETQTLRLVTAGHDNNVKIWVYERNKELREEISWNVNSLMNDMAFANNPGFSYDLLAGCSEDSIVRIWRRVNTTWKEPLVLTLKSAGKKLNWSLLGTILTVTTDNGVYVYEEKDIDNWQLIEETK